MKRILILLSAVLLTGISDRYNAQAGDGYPLNGRLKIAALDDSRPQSYKVSLHWINRDLDGKLVNDNTATANYTRGFADGSVAWNDVRLDGKSLEELDGLHYRIVGDNLVKQSFYDAFPQKHIDLVRWFVQDAAAIEAYAWMYLDSLKLNDVFQPVFFKNQRIDIENYVNLTSRGLNLCWTGISERNNKRCAVVRYQSMYNPVDADTDAMKLRGRTLFWGDIWISLADRHIEYATMNEDVVYTLVLPANGTEQRLNLQRDIIFEGTEDGTEK